MKEKYINAFIIGFMVAALVWGIAKNNIGLFTLIPLFIIYKIVNINEVLKNFSHKRHLF